MRWIKCKTGLPETFAQLKIVLSLISYTYLLDAAYKFMAEDEARETEALGWAEALIGAVKNEQRWSVVD